MRKCRAALAAIAAAVATSSITAQSDAATAAVTRQVADYIAPPVTLLDSTGRAVDFEAVLKSHQAAIVEFIYTSCSTICGLQTSALAVARPKLGADVAILSVSIDPEYDTPQRLHEFGKHFGVSANWHMLTGRKEDITKILTAFQARPYGDNKMLHRPLVFIRPGANRQWFRLEGLMNGDQLAGEFRKSVAHPSPPHVERAGRLDNLLAWFGR